MGRELIDESSYGPETLKILYQAFDDAWETIAPKYAGDPDRAEIARLKLANTILSFPVEKSQTSSRSRIPRCRLAALGYVKAKST